MEHWRDNPHRPPDWRWQRVNAALRANGPPISVTMDRKDSVALLRRATKFLRRFNLAATEIEQWRCQRRNPDIYWAHQIYHEDSMVRKSALEARLLARETDQHIAALIGISPATVAAYEALFFNVRGRLAHRDWVLHCIIGEQVHFGLTGRDYALLWKLFGYIGGPYVLDAIMSPVAAAAPAMAEDEVNAFLLDVAQNGIKRKAAQIASVAPVDAKTYELLLGNFVKFIEIERTTNASGSNQEQLMINISAMLDELPFVVGGAEVSDVRLLGADAIAVYDEQGIELRTDDLLLAGASRQIPHTDRYDGATYPNEG